MLSMRKCTREIIAALKPLVATSILLLVGLVAIVYLTPPVQGADSAQTVGQNQDTRQEMMASNGVITSTMSMAEMGAMMDVMLAQMTSMMAGMPMSGTMPMSGMMSMTQMGQMMQMMGMMHQQMGQMQMMMGAMMSGGMMDEMMMDEGMMGQGMGTENATPKATQVVPEVSATVEPQATTTVSDTTADSVPETAASNSGLPAAVLATAAQSVTAGAVTVEATPLNTEGVTEGLLDIAFAISLETHSVELDFDLAARATLTIGETSFPAVSWEPNASSGHHVAGTLHFTIDEPTQAALAEIGTATLKLQEIDGEVVTLHFAIDEE